jgi:hypothetical protein
MGGIVLLPCDIILTRGQGLISSGIRVLTRHIGESRTLVNHVGVCVEAGDFKTCKIVEALHKVECHSLWDEYGPEKEDHVSIFRPRNMSNKEQYLVAKYAYEQVGKSYGYMKIITHALDYFMGGAYVFRRLTNSSRYPICSWIVAHAFKQTGRNFGVKPGAAQPDDIWDFVVSHPHIYKQIFPLQRIW